MTNLQIYLQDGANYQARAVLMLLQGKENIQSSWNEERRCYEAEINVARWENCREQGYVVSLCSKNYSKQINIAFFEHRNSDSIHAIKWEQTSTNSINIETAKFDNVYKDKYDTSFSVEYGEIVKMTDWVFNELEKFWELTKERKEK